MAEDDGGVLGNLPHSRPGTRSDKRESRRAATAAGEAAKRAERTGSPAAEAAPGTRGAAAPRRSTAAGPPPAGERPSSPRGDPLGSAVRLAAEAAGAGLRVAGAVAREVLRRVPRP